MYQRWASVIFDTIFLMSNQCKGITINIFYHFKQKTAGKVRNALNQNSNDPFSFALTFSNHRTKKKYCQSSVNGMLKYKQTFSNEYGKLKIMYGIFISSFWICYLLFHTQHSFVNLYPKLTITLLTLYLVPQMDQTGPCPFHHCRTVSFYCSPQHTVERKGKTVEIAL